jgi:hypothetical protein
MLVLPLATYARLKVRLSYGHHKALTCDICSRPIERWDNYHDGGREYPGRQAHVRCVTIGQLNEDN